jgi:hypothetical protein
MILERAAFSKLPSWLVLAKVADSQRRTSGSRVYTAVAAGSRACECISGTKSA